MAIKKTVELSVEATAAIRATEELGLTFAEAYGEADNLSGQIGEMEDKLYALANAGDNSSTEFKMLTQEIGKAKKVIIDTDMAVDAMSQTMAQKVGGSLNGVTAGFELGAGAMGAFGVESEQVEEALLRVQSAMAISQGIQGIREAIPAFKAMKTAIMGNVVVQKLLNFVMSLNPIGLIIIAVAALSAALYALATPIKKLTDWFYGVEDATLSTEEANEKLNKSYEKTAKLIDDLGNAAKKRLSHELNMLKLTGASEEELHRKRLQQIKAEELIREASQSNEKINIKNKQQLYKNALAEGNSELATTIKDEIKQHREKYKDLKSQDKDYDRAKKELEQEEINRKADQRKADYDKYKTHLEKKLALEREIEDRRLALTADSEKKEQAQSELKRKREVEAAKGNTELIDIINQEAFERRKEISAKWDAEIQNIKLERIPEEVKELAVATTEANTNYGLTADEQLAVDVEVWNARLDMASSTFGALGDLATAFAGDSEAQQKRAFDINKVVGISQAVISTAQGIMAQLAVPQDALTGANFIKAGIVAATGAAQIATIAKTKFQGGGSSVSGVASGGSAGGGGDSRPANFNVVGNDGNNQLADSLSNQVTKTYVVASDVTTQQSLDRNKLGTATL